jgi:Uma2 family endonuclease
MSRTLKEKQTYDDYLKTPMGGKYQLIDGEIIEMTSPTPSHQDTVLTLGMLLKKFANENKLGKVFIAPLDIYLGENETYQPDVFFISKERESIIGEKKIEGAPDLVIEVLSESTAYYDLKKKKAVYEKSGVSEYWIVDPEEKNIEIYENSTSGFQKIALVESSKTYTSKKLTGFILKSEEVFN